MLFIKNIRIIDPLSGTDDTGDILIEEERILKMGGHMDVDEVSALDGDALMVDGEGLVAAPGLVDVHVHFRDPGFTHKEDIGTGAAAAAAGGFTTVVCMANTKPVVDSADTLSYVLDKAAGCDIRVLQAASVTKGMEGRQLTDFEELKRLGAAGFTDDGRPILDGALLRRAMEESARLSVPLSFHEEDPAYIENNGINRGVASAHFSLGGSDRQAEISMIKRDLEMALETGAIINIQHISTKEGVALVREALSREKGERRIHAEACPHHFTLNETALFEFGANAKMNPPLRTEEDRLAVIGGLKDGTIDIIATDHAPHTDDEKSVRLQDAPSGIIGLQTALALGISELVVPGYLSLTELIRRMSTNPAALYGLDAGYLKEGGPADIVIFDENEEWVLSKEMIRSKSCNTPFIGRKLKGRVKALISGGMIVQ